MSRLRIEGLDVRLSGRAVVRQAGFTAGAGEMIALLGPNGAGKTSLLRAVAGLIASEGRIVLDGRDASLLSRQERAKAIGYLPQGHLLHWPLPVKEIVALGRYPLGLRDSAQASAEDRAAIDAAMAATDVAVFAARDAAALSGGERARVALARVLALQAPIVLADEPTASLDPRHQIDVMQALKQTASKGALVIVVTHDLLLAARSCARIIVLNQGRIEADGEPDQALSDSVLGAVFGIEALRFVHEGTALTVPWRAS